MTRCLADQCATCHSSGGGAFDSGVDYNYGGGDILEEAAGGRVTSSCPLSCIILLNHTGLNIHTDRIILQDNGQDDHVTLAGGGDIVARNRSHYVNPASHAQFRRQGYMDHPESITRLYYPVLFCIILYYPVYICRG